MLTRVCICMLQSALFHAWLCVVSVAPHHIHPSCPLRKWLPFRLSGFTYLAVLWGCVCVCMNMCVRWRGLAQRGLREAQFKVKRETWSLPPLSHSSSLSRPPPAPILALHGGGRLQGWTWRSMWSAVWFGVFVWSSFQECKTCKPVMTH